MELNQIAESIGAINTPTIGIAGEARCVITGVDGEVRLDTGYFDNLILNQGLDFFGGGKGGSINSYCAIGSGNSAPLVTQTKLDAFIAIASGTNITSSYAYTDTGDGMYRMWEQKKYRFTTNVDLNISELGLVSTGTTAENYYLTTRVLPKDSLGAPTSLSLKKGETLDAYYKLHKVIDTRDKAFVINVLDGNGGAVPYNAVVRPTFVGNDGWGMTSDFNDPGNLGGSEAGGADLSAITTAPSLGGYMSNTFYRLAYVTGSNKRIVELRYGLNDANRNIRTVTSNMFYFYRFQVRFGRVSDDAPLPKTANDTLTIPLEISWGRYEGAL